MNERSFAALCLFVAIAGIFILYIADKSIQPKNVKISEIDLDKNFISINATVVSIKRTGSMTFIKVKDDTGAIDVVVFNENVNTSSIRVGMNIVVIGRPEKYKEKIQVVPLQIIA